MPSASADSLAWILVLGPPRQGSLCGGVSLGQRVNYCPDRGRLFEAVPRPRVSALKLTFCPWQQLLTLVAQEPRTLRSNWASVFSF